MKAFTEAEILAALLTCERDHVAFVVGNWVWRRRGRF
jgi:hypothetical protein